MNQLKFLVIDDEPFLRMLTADTLADRWPDALIVEAGSYQEALSAFREHGAFDGVFSDYSFPGKLDPRIADPREAAKRAEVSGGPDVYSFIARNGIDTRLTYISGSDAAGIVQELGERRAAAIALSGVLDPQIIGIGDILQKPVPARQIVEAAERMVAGGAESELPGTPRAHSRLMALHR